MKPPRLTASGTDRRFRAALAVHLPPLTWSGLQLQLRCGTHSVVVSMRVLLAAPPPLHVRRQARATGETTIGRSRSTLQAHATVCMGLCFGSSRVASEGAAQCGVRDPMAARACTPASSASRSSFGAR